jgi:hypothetical protein
VYPRIDKPVDSGSEITNSGLVGRKRAITPSLNLSRRGASATDDKRPVFQQMIERACVGENAFDVIA